MKKLIPTLFIFCALGFSNGKGISASGNGLSLDSALYLAMRDYAISPDSFNRKIFYTWTKPEQIEELKNGKELLSRGRGKDGSLSTYETWLMNTDFDLDPVIKILREERFFKKRFAWPYPWATVMGWRAEQYGDQLLKITLRDSAIIVKFSPNCVKKYSYLRVNGDTLNEEYVLDHPDCIGAVYFVATKKEDRMEKIRKRTLFKRKVGTIKKVGYKWKTKYVRNSNVEYREYVICNPLMIESWEYGTEAITTELKTESGYFDQLAYVTMYKSIDQKYFYSSGQFCYTDNFYQIATGKYYEMVAFPNDYYLLNRDRMKAISDKLNAAITAQQQPSITGK